MRPIRSRSYATSVLRRITTIRKLLLPIKKRKVVEYVFQNLNKSKRIEENFITNKEQSVEL